MVFTREPRSHSLLFSQLTSRCIHLDFVVRSALSTPTIADRSRCNMFYFVCAESRCNSHCKSRSEIQLFWFVMCHAAENHKVWGVPVLSKTVQSATRLGHIHQSPDDRLLAATQMSWCTTERQNHSAIADELLSGARVIYPWMQSRHALSVASMPESTGRPVQVKLDHSEHSVLANRLREVSKDSWQSLIALIF